MKTKNPHTTSKKLKKKERLGILSLMINLAKADNTIKKSEYSFLVAVAAELGIDKVTFHRLFKRKFKIPTISPENKVFQFYKLIELMFVDEEGHRLEIERLRILGLSLGLKPSVILDMLDAVSKHNNGLVPFETLFGIYERSNNQSADSI